MFRKHHKHKNKGRSSEMFTNSLKGGKNKQKKPKLSAENRMLLDMELLYRPKIPITINRKK